MASHSQSEKVISNNHHLKQKRARSQLSCSPCRIGKLKCNREKPHCDQCIKRNREGQCIFVPPPVKHKPVQNVKGRIRQLEELVVDLMNQNHVSTGPQQHKQGGRQDNRHESVTSHDQPTPPSDNDTSLQFSGGTERSQQSGTDEHTPPSPDDIDATTTPFGQMRISKNEISYVGDSHWNAILNSISDLKRDLGDEEEEDDCVPESNENPLDRSDTNRTAGWSSSTNTGGMDTAVATSGLGFMLGSTQAVTKEELVAGMPEKKVADRLLSLWFNSPDPFKSVIHAPTFQEEYKRFWRSPKDTPTMWLGLLFAIMSLAASFGLRDVDPSSPQALKVLNEVNRYHSLAASAAVLADFTKPREYTIECLIAYTAGLRSNNAFVNVWLMVGLIVRLALRMGYHRDGKHYPNITPFHGEMRRRAWAAISMIDVLISFQLGLPSMVKTIQSDAQPPRNLLDRDFSISTTVLPPSRGEHELTPSSYTRAKLGMTRVFANAAELSHATVPPAHEELMQLDRQLEEAKALIPPLLQMPDISELVTDPAEQLMCRFNLDLLYLKTKMVLHRRYILTPLSQLSPEEQKLGIGCSRKVCISCALRVLQHHHTIYTASQAGGQLESVKWYMGSISTHDFLLAAMLVCLELSTHIQPELYLLVNPSGHRCPIRGALIEALEKSQRIWTESTRRKKTSSFNAADENLRGEQMFDETEKAARAMGVMIGKVRARFGVRGSARAWDGELAPEYWGEAALEGNKKGKGVEGRTPFNGVVSTYDWGSMVGVPELVNGATSAEFEAVRAPVDSEGGDTAYDPDINSGNETSEGGIGDLSNGTSLDHHTPGPSLDFSVIGNMLDFNPADGAALMNMDWEMWDNQISSAQQTMPASQDWPEQLGGGVSSASAHDFGDIRFGDPLVGGSGVVGDGEGEGTAAAGVPLFNASALDNSLWINGLAAITAAAGAGSAPFHRPGQPGTAPNTNGARIIPRGPSTVAWGGSGLWGIDFGTEIEDSSAADTTGGGGGGAAGDGSGGDMMGSMGTMDFDMGVPLKDTGFDGGYPATRKDDWQEYWKGSGGGGRRG
ncbi:hypothetical protein B0A55_01583 [Friedmanniomyces simplex]|uniref:Zn(2)-C6 fungal-type domain-containing protein n=1 Tax=Friedmanniomyces simplex TaxID=329884 RepID=A0A4U0Y2R0_9PEZI|nr:hypothetical protein B0A55_01583 [Friedmanniomyces simplex]